MKEALERLFDHLEWANGILLESLRSSGELSAFVKKVTAHIFAAEQVWLSRIRDEPPPGPPVWPELTLSDCARLLAGNCRSFRAVLDSTNEEGLQKTISYANSKGERFSTRLADILLHVSLHGSYHRGQIAARQRLDSHEPVNTDYITFVRAGRKKSGI
jgi:uncharacterized damage-inducible protein DinB